MLAEKKQPPFTVDFGRVFRVRLFCQTGCLLTKTAWAGLGLGDGEPIAYNGPHSLPAIGLSAGYAVRREAMERYLSEFQPPSRLLMGAGPCNVHPRVLRAMVAPLIGHMDPDFLAVMDDVREMLRQVFQTGNHLTLPISGTGTAGTEAAMVNVLEPGDTVVVGVNGYFGQRMAEVARRVGAAVHEVSFPYGGPVDTDVMREEVERHPRVKVIGVVHGETSTGVLNPLTGLAALAREAGALLVVDAVTSLGGVDVKVDEWGVDVCYGSTQKCLACPPGLSPITVSERAEAVIDTRRSPVQSFYLDISMLRRYWGQRAYHHTAPISMVYALREGLRLLLEEGLENHHYRHLLNATGLWAGLKALSLDLVAQEGCRLPCLTAIWVPDGVDEAAVRRRLLERHGIEIGAGIGELAGRSWRIGLMGYNATSSNVLQLLSALEEALMAQGYEVPVGASLAAAQRAIRDGRSPE